MDIMMTKLKILLRSRAIHNAGASYLSFISTAFCGLISVPIAVSYLTKIEMGIWTMIITFVAYLLCLDFGIGQATGRKIADSIAKHDQTEINKWWTLSVGVLCLLGLFMLLVALAISPYICEILNVPPEQKDITLWIFIGTACMSALSMPFRIYPGLLVAQERFHWVPLVQAISPWIQLLGFWLLLRAGWGLSSYLPAALLSQVTGWVILIYQVHGKDMTIEVNLSGFTKSRFKELFSYSSGLAMMGLSGSILASMPALLLARLGGLALVPVYNLSNKIPGMVNSVGQRTTQAFYPNLQKLCVTGQRERFITKYKYVTQLGIWVSLIGAAAVISFNRSIICWLADVGFYAGHWTNVWLACAVITISYTGGTANFLQYVGNLRKIALFSILELPVGALLMYIGFQYWKMEGLSAGFAILPLLMRAPYAIYAGSREYKIKIQELYGYSTLMLITTLILIMVGGLWCDVDQSKLQNFNILGRTTSFPTCRELILAVALAAVGIANSFYWVTKIKSIK